MKLPAPRTPAPAVDYARFRPCILSSAPTGRREAWLRRQEWRRGRRALSASALVVGGTWLLTLFCHLLLR